MKKSRTWNDEETDILNRILKQFGGSPSRAYSDHPEWKTALKSHTDGAVYAKLYNMRGKPKAKGVPIGVQTSAEAAMAAPRQGSKLVVVNGELQPVVCPHCKKEFHVIEMS